MSATYEELRDQLAELIAIPSVSADPAHAGDVVAAAGWVAEKIRDAGGSVDVVPWNGGRPLVIGEVAASERPESSPTVLCYAHFDVQPPDPLELWESPPFELTERDGWLYARGVADDKAQLLILVEAARGLAAAGELPVNVRFALDSEEEVGGQSISEWVAADERGADAAIVFDGGLEELGVPTFNTALRGLCYFHVTVRTGERDLHSGLFGGVALNALHALMQSLSAVVARDGRVPEPLRIGVVPPAPEEIEGWRTLAEGAEPPGGGRSPTLRRGSARRVLRAHVGGAVRGRPRDSRRLAGPREDGPAGRGEGERLNQDRAGAERGRRERRVRTPSPRGGAGRSRHRREAPVVGGTRARLP